MNEIANKICKKYSLYQCGPCVRALYDKFKDSGVILMIDVVGAAPNNRHFIVHISNSNQSITDSGKHFGYEIDGEVYGNFTPNGTPRGDWMSSFEYYNKVKGPSAVTHDLVSELCFKDFVKYSGSK